MRQRWLVVFALSVCLSLAAVAPAQASPIIYDNGLPSAVSGNEMTSWIQAEDFVLEQAMTLTDVHFWAFQFTESSYQGSIYYRIYADDGANAPDETNVLSQGLVVPTRLFDHNTGFGPSYSYSFDLVAPLELSAGTRYWLGLHNGPLSTDDRLELYWESTLGNGTFTAREDFTPFDIGGWFDNEQEHAFYLTGTTAVPEPASLLLLGSGLAALAARRRQTAKKR